MILRELALISILLWSLWVALEDLRTFRIRNTSLSLGVFLLWPCLLLLGERFQISTSKAVDFSVVLFIGLRSFIGMGDVKLILIILPWLHFAKLQLTLEILICFSWVQLLWILLLTHKFPDRIAFAPAILLAATINMAT